MKKIATLLYLGVVFISCQPETEPPVDNGPLNDCTIEVDVRTCPTTNCFDPEDLVGLNVELYESYFNAVEGVNPIYTDTTNQNGWVKFYDLYCYTTPSVRIDLGVYGVFVGSANFFNSNQVFDVITYPNFFYDFNHWHRPIVQEVSLDIPAVGQYSAYQYFEVPEEHTFGDELMTYQTGVNLQTYITRQDGPNEFYVAENLGNYNNTYLPSLGISSNHYLESLWRFDTDTLFISNPDPTNGIISMIWNITSDEDLINGEFAIPLSNGSMNFLDMDDAFEMPPPDWRGIGACSDFQTQSFLFEDLLVEKRNYTGDDGPLKYLVFSKRNGLLRSLHYTNEDGQFSSGFDLLLN